MVKDIRWHKDQAGAWDILGDARGRIAFDIGGNQGQAANVLAKNFHTVVSLEPCKESFDILLVESPPNVVPLMVAASDHTGEVTLTESEDSIQSGQLTTGSGLGWGDEVGTRTVECVTIDDLIAHYGRPDFVKIDVENHEVQVMRGWSRPHCDVLIEVHNAENEGPLREMYDGRLRKLEHERRVPARIRSQHFWLASR